MITPASYPLTRRRLLTASTLAAVKSWLTAAEAKASPLGLCTFSCHQQWKAVSDGKTGLKFSDALSFYRYARALGATGVQTPLRGSDPRAMHQLVEGTQGYYEADLRLPQAKTELPSFEQSVKAARAASATLARTVCLGGRRYETFHSLEEFRQFQQQAKRSLEWCEPILKKHSLRLAVENHKDHTAAELVALMKGLSSEWIGVLVDTGNNIALLEEPHSVVEALAPYALSVHLKDMAAQPHAQGFLLSEVPLGTGMLDLPRMVKLLQQHRPALPIHLEMATRDPLLIPCLTESYYSTMPEWKATHLAAAMQRVTEKPASQPVPSVRDKTMQQVLAEEEQHNRVCLDWMQQQV